LPNSAATTTRAQRRAAPAATGRCSSRR
jgi:hypothetical protein